MLPLALSLWIWGSLLIRINRGSPLGPFGRYPTIKNMKKNISKREHKKKAGYYPDFKQKK